MDSLFPADYSRPFFQSSARFAIPKLAWTVAEVQAPDPGIELLYVETYAIQGRLFRWYRRAFIPEGGRVEYWAQEREDPQEAA